MFKETVTSEERSLMAVPGVNFDLPVPGGQIECMEPHRTV